jgi:DNA polymerase
METLQTKVQACVDCRLHRKAKKVFGEGNVCSKIVIVGEAPGEDENFYGRPFVGKAGKLLRKILQAIEVDPEDLFILNMVKCRPPGNRNPLPNELVACRKWLNAQFAILRPNLIITLGAVATQTLLNTQLGIMKLKTHLKIRGRKRIVPLLHPGFFLRQRSKGELDEWKEDFRTALALAEVPPPEGKSWWKYLSTT